MLSVSIQVPVNLGEFIRFAILVHFLEDTLNLLILGTISEGSL